MAQDKNNSKVHYVREKVPKAVDVVRNKSEKVEDEKNTSKSKIKNIELNQNEEKDVKENIKEDVKHEVKPKEKPKEDIEKEIEETNQEEQVEDEQKVEDKKEKTEKAEKNKGKHSKGKSGKGVKIFAWIFCILFVVLLCNCVFGLYYQFVQKDIIVNGVSVANVDVSGLTTQEAKDKLSNEFAQKQTSPFELLYEETVLSISPETIVLNYDIDSSIYNAFMVGRSDLLFINNFEIIKTLFKKQDLEVDVSFDEQQTINVLNEFSKSLPGYKQDPTYVVDGSNLVITSGKEGITADNEYVLNELKDLFKTSELIGQVTVPVVNQEPEQISLEQIRSEIYTEAQDAYYTKQPFVIHQEVIGIDFNIEEAQAILAVPQETYTIPLVITKPNKTVDSIGTEAFPDRLGTSTTSFNPGDVGRTQNLRVACQKINGKVLMPGQTFSYNQTLGERTIANGYKYGKVYENGRVVDGIGGGICQISSTLYNAVLKADLQINERKNHMFVTSYMPAGLDATVVYGSIDFKFTNTRSYPIRIVASLNGSYATVSIYGNKEDVEYDISFNRVQLSTIPYTTVYETDTTLEPDVEKVVQSRSSGSVWQTTLVKSLNGQVVETKFLSKDTYSPMQRIIKKGSQ